ncbi:MAG: hypothetical protein HOK06_02915 [Rhodospirillaceae bacterium]|jgi:hypothetical protein|nr:hypothetical protein [Rhodospirillaceae bacterium]MBT6406528.1 hypothetical protein [Rhodospirillaceae bacterium]
MPENQRAGHAKAYLSVIDAAVGFPDITQQGEGHVARECVGAPLYIAYIPSPRLLPYDEIASRGMDCINEFSP